MASRSSPTLTLSGCVFSDVSQSVWTDSISCHRQRGCCFHPRNVAPTEVMVFIDSSIVGHRRENRKESQVQRPCLFWGRTSLFPEVEALGGGDWETAGPDPEGQTCLLSVNQGLNPNLPRSKQVLQPVSRSALSSAYLFICLRIRCWVLVGSEAVSDSNATLFQTRPHRHTHGRGGRHMGAVWPRGANTQNHPPHRPVARRSLHSRVASSPDASRTRTDIGKHDLAHLCFKGRSLLSPAVLCLTLQNPREE